MRFCVFILGALALAQSPAELEIRKLLDGGKYREADPLVRALLKDAEAKHGPESEEVGMALDLFMEMLVFPGGAMDADTRALAARAIAVQEKLHGPKSKEFADTLMLASSVYWEHREPIPSLPLAERAVRIYEELSAAGALQHEYANALGALANAQRECDDLEAAKATFLKAQALYDKIGEAESRESGTNWNNLAGIQSRLRDFGGARASYTKAIAIQEKTLGPDHPYVAYALNNLGATLTRSGNFTEAVAPLERSAALTEKLFGPESPRTATAINNLAQALVASGRFAEGLALYERGRDIYGKTIGTEGTSYAQAMAVYASALGMAGRTKDAAEAAIQAENIIRAYYESAMRGLPEREALLHAEARATGARANGLNILLSLAAAQADPKPALDQLIRSRAEVFDEMAARHHAAAIAGDAEVDALSAALTQARDKLAALVVRGQGAATAAAYASQLKAAREEKEDAERRLASKSIPFRQQLAGTHAGLDEIAASLPEGAALISYVRYVHWDFLLNTPSPNPGALPKWEYIAFVLRAGDRVPSAVRLGSSKEIEDLVHAVREKISQEAADPGRAPQRSEELYREAAARLRRRVWDPLIPHLGASTRVFIVADGELNLVSFGALPTGTTAYLMEKGPMVHYLSAERDLVSPTADRRGQGLLAVGNPSFDRKPSTQTAGLRGSGSCSALQNIRFDRLPASAGEVEDIATLWKKSEGSALVLTGTSASKAAFLQQAEHKRVVHLATHGFFLGADCKRSGEQASNPLLLSGLVLAGANERNKPGVGDEENGILTAEEIAGMRLDGVDWAVLSACDTALGEMRAGEGVFGLRRAFQLAGAKTVIMSVWPVDDQVTRSWMRVLYQGRFSDHLDTAQAVQQASLSLLKARRKAGESTHPLYWGAFIAAGGWR